MLLFQIADEALEQRNENRSLFWTEAFQATCIGVEQNLFSQCRHLLTSRCDAHVGSTLVCGNNGTLDEASSFQLVQSRNHCGLFDGRGFYKVALKHGAAPGKPQ